MEKNQTLQKWYLHVDLDAFFASVEQLDHPEYRGKPVIVGGKPEDRRGVVSTASYEARKFGVHSAMPTFQAYKLCPQGIFVHGRMDRYSELSYQIMNILKDFSPDVDQMSIDEAFIDITGTEKLFGSPEQIAFSIKDRVKKETGLSISVGLAPTKYLAKLASDYNKPDGFFCINPGNETDFMLQLPLKKVWGVGSKSLETLNKAGIKTTKDIYEKDLDLLTFMFGKNFADFLYNAVRGKELESFGKPTKFHSISAETTFPYDINDIYLLETKILDLAHGVYFRLLKENSFSRTAFIKIRYDDFSTFTVQETQENNICTLDSFYEILKRLFEKKYENGRSIRLLGVGFDNVELEDRPFQQSLFENNDKKKQQIEKAILKLQKKHPEIEIKKARTIKSIALIIILSALFAKNPLSMNADTLHKTDSSGSASIITNTLSEPEKSETENEQTLFNWNINEKNKVDFYIDGYWKQKIESGFNLSIGDSGNTGFSFNTPVFTQEVDLSTYINLNNKWFFEAIFAEEFEKNTFSIGYDTPELKAKASNRNIIFPKDYSASFFGYGLNGGNNEAPGISLHFQNQETSPISADFLLRYEMTENCNLTFYGYNLVSDYNFEISDFKYGKYFIFPESFENLSKIKNIYVEDSNGTYKDKYSRKFKKLDDSEYLILKTSKKIILSDSAKAGKNNNKIPVVLVTFENGIAEELLSECGSFSDENSFFGKIQQQFEEDLSKYTNNLENSISEEKAICIQNNSGFSPFLCSNIYDLGIISDADVFVKSKSTEKENNSFTSEILDNNFGDDFFNVKHLFAEIYSDNRFPFSRTNPEIYFTNQSNSDLEITARTYSKITSFDIGTKAIAGTVVVYINGIIDSGATFNDENGTVSLSKNVNETDKIYITWQEESKAYNTGAFAFGGGIQFTPNKNLSSDFSLTTRWPISLYSKYSTVDNSLLGFTALSGGISYKKDNFSISDKASISLQNTNSTGNLLVSTSTCEDETFYNSISSGYKTLTTPVLNLENQTILLEEESCGTVENYGGKTDSTITGYKIPLEWDFSGLTNIKNNWASVDIKLNYSNLKSTSQLELALLPDFDNTITSNDIEVYIQLGITAESDFSGEDSYSIPTWLISEENNKCTAALDVTKNEWQTVKINLTDSDRSKISSNSDLRLIILKKENSTLTKGIIYTGPYEPLTETAYVLADENILTNSKSVSSLSFSAKELNLEENYGTQIDWIIADTNKITDSNSQISVSRYFSQADFSEYKTINLDFKFEFTGIESFNSEDSGDFTFILDSGEDTSPAINLLIYDFANLIKESDDFHTLSINIYENKVFLDKEALSENSYVLFINKNIIPDRENIIFDVLSKDSIYKSGSLLIDNLYYSESTSKVAAQNNLNAEYKKNGTILKIKDFDFLKDGFIKANTTQSGIFSVNQSSDITSAVNSAANSEITIASIKTAAEIDTKYSNKTSNLIQTAGHSAKSTTPLFKIISFEETYRYNKADKQLSKKNNLSLDFSKYKIPLRLSGDFNSTDSLYLKKQNSKLGLDFSIPISKCKMDFNSVLDTNQKIKETLSLNSYYKDWLNISKETFSLGNENASARQVLFENKLSFKLPFADFTPNADFKMESNYKNISTAAFTDKTNLIFTLPFTIKNNNFTFTLDKEAAEKQLILSGGNYLSDSQKLFSHVQNNVYFYEAIPFYELFDQNLKSKVLSAGNNLENLESNSYSANYNFNWKRKLYNNYLDFFVPSSTTVAISRNIDSSAYTSDYYQLKSVISNACVNIFGKQSKLRWFKFYNSDEYLSSFTGIIKIPAINPENTTFGISAYSQSVFYITNNNSVKEGLNYSIDTDSNWNFASTTLWSHNPKTSPIGMVVNLIPDKNNSKKKITEKETLSIQLTKSDSDFKQIYGLEHLDEVNFLKYYTLGCSVGFSYTAVSNSTDTLGATLTISGKMEF